MVSNNKEAAMRGWLIGLVLVVGFTGTAAAEHVNGYYRRNGTYVNGYERSERDDNPYNNYSFPGNTNPYTGVQATGNEQTYLDNYYHRRSERGAYGR